MRLTVDDVVVEIERGTSGGYFATSPQIKGLLVASMTLAGVRDDLPGAIAEMKAALSQKQ